MPELPEVETIKRELERNIINKHCLKPVVINNKCLQTPKEEYINGINNTNITSLSREGKFLIIHLDNNHKILFHLRMEGKLFYEEDKELKEKHLSLYIPFDNGYHLAFYDTRKFGVTYYLKEDEKGPLSKLGLEPSQITNESYLIEKIKSSNKCIKELLLDQSIISGLGNIYADEVLYACDISPMKKGKEIQIDEAKKIIKEAQRILKEAIKNNGSTIKSYQASSTIHGDFQEFLKVYGKENTTCSKCKKLKIERKRINGRSTHYCPHCQSVGISVAVTGNIASGKSTVTKLFVNSGYVYFSADEEVNKLYEDKTICSEIKKEFPAIVNNNFIDKEKILNLLISDTEFNKKYLGLIYQKIREKIYNFFIENNGKQKVLEIPLLFNAKLEDLFTVIVGVESNQNIKLLEQRNSSSIKEKILLDKQNKYKEKRHKANYIITNNTTIENLEKETKKVIKEIEYNYISFK